MGIPENLSAVNRGWLNQVLRQSGAVPRGEVVALAIHPVSTFERLVAKLALDYDGWVPLTAPRSMELRLSAAFPSPLAAEAERDEVRFYQLVAPRLRQGMIQPPIAHCFAAGHQRDVGRSFLLLEDTSANYVSFPGPLAPTLSAYGQAIDALATLHAFWWDHPELEDIGELPNVRQEDFYLNEVGTVLPDFLDNAGGALSHQQRDAFWRALDGRKALTARLLSGHDYTVRNGTAYANRFLYPNNTDTHVALLEDWSHWTVSLGMLDVSCLLACSLLPAQRRQLERYLVRRYWQRLCALEVTHYTWEQCWRDYRDHIAMVAFAPMWKWALGEPISIWWPLLENVLAAFEDLTERTLLPSATQIDP